MPQFDPTSIPQEYRGIHFDTWLEVFLEFAVMQAQQGQVAEAYDTITAAWDANVFYHSTQSSLLIHICWFSMQFLLPLILSLRKSNCVSSLRSALERRIDFK